MGYWKDYLREVARAFWHALERTDTLVILVLIAAGIGSLWFGGHPEHPSWQVAFGIFLVSLFVLLVKMPYTLYAEQRATINSLNQRLTPKIQIFVDNNGVREETFPVPGKRIQIGVSCATDAELEDCEAWLVKARKIGGNPSDNDRQQEILEEKVHCVWSIEETTRLTLRPKLAYYANIFYVSPLLTNIGSQINEKSNVKIFPLTKPDNNRLTHGIDAPGQYQLEISVSAKGVTKTASESLIFDCRDYGHVSLIRCTQR